MARYDLPIGKKEGVHFRFAEEKAVAAVLYLIAKNIEALDKYKLAKLLFLADKFHLVRYGRPITGDEYCALPYGPVPSATLNILNREENEHSTPLTFAVQMDRRYANPRYSLKGEIPFTFEELSKSDTKTLDLIVQRHGPKTFDELKALTHEMPAYTKAWASKGKKKSVHMNYEDFFEEDSDAIEGMFELMIEDAPFF
jgi:uncharacterized phage-associated protein